MVDMPGVSGLPEPKPGGPQKARNEREQKASDSAGARTTSSKVQDDVLISSEARAAAEVARLLQEVPEDMAVRNDKVDEARAALERGEHKDPEVVAQVAERLLRFFG